MRQYMIDKIVEETSLQVKPNNTEKGPKKTGHFWKKYKAHVCLGSLAIVIALVLVIQIVPIYLNAQKIGNEAGEALGSVVGCAVGSFRGITEGIPTGLEEGKVEGLSAKDTEVGIGTRIKGIGELEVLKAGVRLDNYFQIANDYKALYVYKADAIFTVDLAGAEIVMDEQDNKIKISLDVPAVSFYINDTETSKITEWQRRFYSGKTEDGYQAYINSRAEIENKASEEIANYDTLMELAKDSAKKQIEILAGAAGDKEVVIIFTDEGR